MNTNYQNQKILVLGMGLSGRSMVSFLKKRGAFVLGFDDHVKIENPPCTVYSSIHEVPFKDLDLIVFSPGVKGDHPVILKAKKEGNLLLGEIELGARELKNPCIAITGTNGKSSVTALITHLLNCAGKPALALGNIGIPLTSRVDEIKDQILVLELSSYQIEALKSKFIDLALVLNLTPDHLDRYKTFKNYGSSKFLIQNALREAGSFYIEKGLSKNWEDFIFFQNLNFFNSFLEDLLKRVMLDQKSILFFTQMSALERLNCSAAIAACKAFSIEDEALVLGIQSFKGLPHRCEFVNTINQVHFYNDSKATNSASVIKAVTSFRTPLLMIMGGEDKGLDFSSLVPYFKDKVKKIYVIGKVKEKMQRDFSSEFDVQTCLSLEEALKLAYKHSQPKDTVLLAPATSSFDMFQNFEHRGNEFKRIVNQLEGEQS